MKHKQARAAAPEILKALKGFDPANAPSASRVLQLLTLPPGGLRKRLLRAGNEKLSRRILTFGLPAVMTCPGRSELCGGAEALCYATHNRYKNSFVAKPRLENYVLACRDDFAELVLAELPHHRQRVVRPHDSGDLFSEAYAQQWLRVMKASPNLRFFIFSRSWRVREINAVLGEMASLSNARVWYSVDRETGWPSKLPEKGRVAYMQADAGDLPDRPTDLVFRDHAARGEAARRVGGALVCPYENGFTRDPSEGGTVFNCHNCGLCWGELGTTKDPREHHDMKVAGSGRLALPLVKLSA